MAEVSEGFTVNGSVVLDDLLSSCYIADIYHDRGIITEETFSRNGTVILSDCDTSLYIGEIKRANSGSQGFTIKGSVGLDVKDTAIYLADVAYSRLVINNNSSDILSSIILDSTENDKYIGEIKRANSGNQGFTVKSTLYLDDNNVSDYSGDIAYARSRHYDDNLDIDSVLVLDVSEDSEILADLKRANQGQYGFTVKALNRLDNFDNNQNIADVFRSINGYELTKTKVIYYKGKKYLLYRYNQLYYVLTEP